MKNLIFFFAFFSFSILSCNTATDHNENKVATENKNLTGTEDWNLFWQNFQKSVANNDMGKIVKMTKLPIKGNFFKTNMGDGLSQKGLIKNYKIIIGDKVGQRIENVKPEEWKTIHIKDEAQAKEVGAPIGADVKSLQLKFILDGEAGKKVDAVQIFNFAKIDGAYKWCSMYIYAI